MADTGISTSHALKVKQYDDKAFREYSDKLVLKPYMGTETEAVIQVKENLSKGPGDTDTFGLVGALQGEGVEDDATLEGNEEEMNLYDDTVTLKFYKNAVRSAGQLSERRTAFDLKDEARGALTTWAAQKTENLLFSNLASINGTVYASATESAKDSFLASNADRFLFGATVANNSSNDHSASLLNVDGTNDSMRLDIVSLAKRMAQLCSPQIRPIKLENGEEWYVMFMHPYAARDLKASSGWQQAQREAQARSSMNPIFTGALGAYDGVVLVESKKCLLLDDVGNGGTTDVAANFLCGAQALVVEYGSMPMRPGSKMILQEEKFDYGTKWGVAAMFAMAHKKAVFNSKQHGVVTVYTSAVAD